MQFRQRLIRTEPIQLLIRNFCRGARGARVGQFRSLGSFRTVAALVAVA